MSIAPISYQPQQAFSGGADFSGLSKLGDVYRDAQNRQKLSDLGKGLASGTLDYRQAAAQTADMGNVDATLKFLALQQQRDELLGTERAGQVAAGALPGIIGAPSASGNAATIAPPPTVSPGPLAPRVTVNPAASAPPPGPMAAPAVDAPAGPTPAAPSPATNYVTPGGTVNGMPKDEAQARDNIAKISQVLAIRNLPPGAKATYEKLLDYNIGELKEPAEIQKLRALGDPVLMARELELRRATKPETNIINKGEEAESKAQGEATVDLFKNIAKEGGTARAQRANIQQLGDLSAKFQTGGPAALQGALADWGIKVGKNVGPVEAYSALIDKMTPGERIPGSGSTSDFDAKMFKRGLPSLIKTPEANTIIRGTHLALADDKVAQAEIAQRYLTRQITAKQALAEAKALPDPFAQYKQWKAAQDEKPQGFEGRFDASRPSGVEPGALEAEMRRRGHIQ